VPGHLGGPGLPGGWEQLGLLGVAGPSSQSLAHHPSQEQGRQGPDQWADLGSWAVSRWGEF